MSEPMSFYCAGAIRGELFYEEYFDKIIEIVSNFGEPQTERVAHKLPPLAQYADPVDRNARERLVAERDKTMIRQSRAVIAEFSGSSTGTGWEVCYATRLHRKPTLCLFHAKSTPSLIIKQDNSKYTIVQEYSDEDEFETYVRCFLEIVTRLDEIDEIRKIYLKSRVIAQSNPGPHEIKKYIESLIEQASSGLLEVQGRLLLDMEKMYVILPKMVNIDFTDAAHFVEFLFKDLILQKRWDRLKSQRIGTTFVSGRKFRIIKALSRFEGPTNLLQIYEREENRIKYTREAFTKNVRAFRKVGLLGTPEKVEPIRTKGGTKIRDQIMLVRTLYGRFEMKSSHSTYETMNSLVIVTQHLQHLSKFVDKFGSGLLVDFLKRSKQSHWYSEIPEISVHNIDEINTSMFLDKEWARRLLKNLHVECRKLWKKSYSSFA